MIIEKRYPDEGIWFEFSEGEARLSLSRSRLNVETAIQDIKSGKIVRTDAAEYRLKEETS